MTIGLVVRSIRSHAASALCIVAMGRRYAVRRRPASVLLRSVGADDHWSSAREADTVSRRMRSFSALSLLLLLPR
jgi:hypothetical protein